MAVTTVSAHERAVTLFRIGIALSVLVVALGIFSSLMGYYSNQGTDVEWGFAALAIAFGGVAFAAIWLGVLVAVAIREGVRVLGELGKGGNYCLHTATLDDFHARRWGRISSFSGGQEAATPRRQWADFVCRRTNDRRSHRPRGSWLETSSPPQRRARAGARSDPRRTADSDRARASGAARTTSEQGSPSPSLHLKLALIGDEGGERTSVR